MYRSLYCSAQSKVAFWKRRIWSSKMSLTWRCWRCICTTHRGMKQMWMAHVWRVSPRPALRGRFYHEATHDIALGLLLDHPTIVLEYEARYGRLHYTVNVWLVYTEMCLNVWMSTWNVCFCVRIHSYLWEDLVIYLGTKSPPFDMLSSP